MTEEEKEIDYKRECEVLQLQLHLLREEKDNLIQKQQEELEKKDEQINELEDKLSLIEEYYDISDLEQIIKEDV